MDRQSKTAAEPAPVNSEKQVSEESEAFKQKGNEFFRSGKFAEAVSSYTQALEVSRSNPQNYIYYCNRATAFFYLKNYEAAEAGVCCVGASYVDCKECLALNPRHMKAYTRLAAVYSKMERYEEAVKACEAGLAIDASNVELSSLLPSLKAHLSASQGQPQGQTQNQPQGQPQGQPNLGNLFQSLASNPMVQNMAQSLSNGQANLSDILNNPMVSQM